MLSWSGRTQEVAVDLASLRVGVPHADALIALADAATLPDGAEGEGARARARARLSAAMGPRAMVDAAAVAANFEMMTRLADATGALLDRLTHHVHILEMNGDSYRLATARKTQRRNRQLAGALEPQKEEDNEKT